jgi:hypothetical protein
VVYAEEQYVATEPHRLEAGAGYTILTLVVPLTLTNE